MKPTLNQTIKKELSLLTEQATPIEVEVIECGAQGGQPQILPINLHGQGPMPNPVTPNPGDTICEAMTGGFWAADVNDCMGGPIYEIMQVLGNTTQPAQDYGLLQDPCSWITFDCNNQWGSCMYDPNGTGQYLTMSDCQMNCNAQPESFDCVAGACVSAGWTGAGQYPDYVTCFNACGGPEPGAKMNVEICDCPDATAPTPNSCANLLPHTNTVGWFYTIDFLTPQVGDKFLSHCVTGNAAWQCTWNVTAVTSYGAPKPNRNRDSSTDCDIQLNGVRSCCDPTIEYTLSDDPMIGPTLAMIGATIGDGVMAALWLNPGPNQTAVSLTCWEVIDNATGPMATIGASYPVQPNGCSGLPNVSSTLGTSCCDPINEDKGCLDINALNYNVCCNGDPACTVVGPNPECCEYEHEPDHKGCMDSTAINYMDCCDPNIPGCTPTLPNPECCKYEHQDIPGCLDQSAINYNTCCDDPNNPNCTPTIQYDECCKYERQGETKHCTCCKKTENGTIAGFSLSTAIPIGDSCSQFNNSQPGLYGCVDSTTWSLAKCKQPLPNDVPVELDLAEEIKRYKQLL